MTRTKKGWLYFLLGLLFFLGFLYRLFPTKPPTENLVPVELHFSLSLPHPALYPKVGEMDDLEISGFPGRLVSHTLVPEICSPGVGGAPTCLPSLHRKKVEGVLSCRGIFRNGCFYLAGEKYLAPGMSVEIEDSQHKFLVQFLSFSPGFSS